MGVKNLVRVWQACIMAGYLNMTVTAQVPFECIVIDPSYSSPAKPYGKAIGDFNGDGQPDLFVSSAAGDGMHWYSYPDWEKHAIRTCGSWSEDCQAVDIDKDGDMDMVNGNNQGLYWYENPLDQAGRPDADEWTVHLIGSDGTRIHDLETADLNGDGRPDVAVRYEKEYGRPVCLFLQVNADDWSVVTSTNPADRKGEGLALGDLDGDGDVDMALGNTWLENKGDGTRWAAHAYAADMPAQMILKIADINHDGEPDIVAAPQSTRAGKLAWYAAGKNKNQSWEVHALRDGITHVHGLAIGDFNNDGYPDIHTSVRHDHPGELDPVSIWISGGGEEPVFREQVLAITGSHFSKAGDVDRDGDLDIFGANWSGPVDLHADILLWRNLTCRPGKPSR
jgi:hypothetical protein